MMTEDEFLQKYLSDLPVFKNWARSINQTIQKELIKRLGNSDAAEQFLRIPPQPRIKSASSIIEKAYYRPGKNYTDPYFEITDKVGIRYVVLLDEEITFLKKIIEDSDIWTASLDRDYEKDQHDNPGEFEYQSVHYILRNKSIIKKNKISIPKNTPCEVQIRTLLQHAHCELTHDTLYKPKMRSMPDVKRAISKSLALIEATGDIFTNVNAKFQEKRFFMDKTFFELKKLYSPISSGGFDDKFNELIIDCFSDNLLKDYSVGVLVNFLQEQSWIIDRVKEKRDVYFLYKQPIILLLFFLVRNHKMKIKENWPLPFEKLKPIYSDLGIGYRD